MEMKIDAYMEFGWRSEAKNGKDKMRERKRKRKNRQRNAMRKNME